jgi:hypothetical protein
MDIDAIEPGMDFSQVVDHSLGSCDVLVALIGKRWLGVTDARGVRRLDKSEDWVRMELTRALEHDRIRVVPALVQGAPMPSSEELPEPLRALTFRHAVELSDTRWNYDVGRLIKSLERVAAEKAGEPPAVPVAAPPAPPPQRRRRPLLIGGAVVAVAAVAVAIVLAAGSGGGSPSGQATRSGTAASSAGGLEDRGCASERSLRSSTKNRTKTRIAFANRTASKVQLYWLDYAGKRKSYGPIGRGGTVNQQTYTKDAWVVTDSDGACLGVYVAAAAPADAVVAPVAPLRDRGCAKEGSVRRAGGLNASTHIVFRNKTANPVSVFWIDGGGKRESYGRLRPGRSKDQPTFVTEPWVVADAVGKCLGVYVAGPETAPAVLSG